MQVQKHLYRIAERSLKSRKAQHYWGVIFGFFFFASIIFISLFLVGHFYILPSNNQLSKCFQKSTSTPYINQNLITKSHKQSSTQKPGKQAEKAAQQNTQQKNQQKTPTLFQIQKDAIYLTYSKVISLKKLQTFRTNNQIIIENQQCTIVKGSDSQSIVQKPLQFSWMPNLLFLDSQDRQLFKFDNYTIFLNNVPTLRYYFYSMNTLIANELINNQNGVFPQNPFIKSDVVSVRSAVPMQLSLVGKAYTVIKAIVYYIIVSIVTSLYIYGTIIAAPAVIILFLRCSSFARNGNMTDVYKIFPWIGMHSLIRETSQNPVIKNSARSICWAIIFYFFFLYFVYYSVVIWISTDIFYQKTESGLQQMLFGFVALVEFCSIVFMRTRPFLRYFPVTHTLLMVLFLVYCQMSSFGLKKLFCIVIITISGSLFSYMVLRLQIPAQQTWDRTKKYTPSVDRPRIGMMPLFSMGWINNLPDEWTLMFPLFGRENFSQRELSFVDRNFEQLDRLFGIQNHQNQNQQELDENAEQADLIDPNQIQHQNQQQPI